MKFQIHYYHSRVAKAKLSQDKGRIAELAAQGDTTMPVVMLFGHALKASGAAAGRPWTNTCSRRLDACAALEKEL
ncbi:MAG: hypothetical protein K6346_02220 [Halothiobacillaceae bacterium]